MMYAANFFVSPTEVLRVNDDANRLPDSIHRELFRGRPRLGGSWPADLQWLRQVSR